ncbi:hypothetical protein LTR37_002254 [Vermiconidia calcicola]|uniref:Uncharacterized protein n=1 Tax=Vermiconidia calcicola TaxID=1690605 RepID=A0ACC3NTL3_9PEZI|nr:hypothetical protein LTR37_002254 [Vermiconidia calcicola]
MIPAALWLLCLTAASARAQETTPTSNEFYTGTLSTISDPQTSDFSGTQYTYASVTGQSTVGNGSSTETASSSDSQITRQSTSQELTLLGGSPANNTGATSTTTAARATNTVPCNGYPEFCNRQYSNITEVCAHNSLFAIENNAGSNQELGIIDQLNDGVRMLQGETHFENDTIWACHTTCELLNAGTWQSSLETLANWLDRHPYDVVTWLIVNSDFVSVDKYVPSIQNSGIARYLYEPDYIPQHRDQWPTLAEMIISGKRLVMFMDYKANQTEVPYILNQFSHMWETPFSPVDRNFPCDQQRPPDLNQTKARDQFMYLANHNLNTAVDLSALMGGGGKKDEILIPNTADINVTNGQFEEFGQLETMSLGCTDDWGRPPNFLLVDYYNYGDPKPGSVFEVAARANGVTYKRRCCGYGESSASSIRSSSAVVAAVLAFAVLLAW